MKTIALLFSILLTGQSQSATPLAEKKQLADFIQSNKQQVLRIAKDKYEYTYYSFPIVAEKCVAQPSPIGVVGVCLVTGLANEENAIAHFAVNVTSDFSGTGDKERKISLTLIDYEI